MRILIVLTLLITCTACHKTITRPRKDITWHNGRLLYQGKKFDGMVLENFVHAGTRRETPYRYGRPHGIEREYTVPGRKLVAKRRYKNGEHAGTHEGWFPTGERRFHYEYNDKAEKHGEFWEWHRSGHPSSFIKFVNGVALGKKVWREDGKIYQNWVFEEGQAYGTPGTKLCFQLRDEGISALTAR